MSIELITRELNRIETILAKAEATGKICVLAEYAHNNEIDPYPIFFTADELFEKITKGEWHNANWTLVDPKEMKKDILERIEVLQKRLIKL